MSGTWLVIPSNRMDNLHKFFLEWDDRGGWDKVVVIEDAPQKSELNWMRLRGHLHYSHKEIAEVLGDDAWIISKKDSACRCFGFLLAWWGGAERVLTLDDDVRPLEGTEDLVDAHMRAMWHPCWLSSVYGLRLRGLPYKNCGTLPDVVANVGLWTGYMDFDAVQQLSLIAKNSNPTYTAPSSNWIIPHGQFAPHCGMNTMIERKALPLAYFPLMGEGQPFARFDDIWMGIILKHCCDALGWHVSVGKPFVDHQKASDSFVNLRKEAPGIGANEQFWERIVAISLTGTHDQISCMDRIGVAMRCWPREEHDGYWNRLGRAIMRWCDAFRSKPKGLNDA